MKAAWGRIACWSVALLGGTALFWMCRFVLQGSWKTLGNADGPRLAMVLVLVTLMVALPVWLLFFPLILTLRRPGVLRTVILLLGSTLAGPAYIAVRDWLDHATPANQTQWYGDPLLALGGREGMEIAAGVGLCCAICYLAALRYVNKDLSQNF